MRTTIKQNFNSGKSIILDQLLVNLDKIAQEQIKFDQNFWKLFFQHQKIIDRETMECLAILNRAYEGMFSSAKSGSYDLAVKQLNQAHYIKNKFEFDENTDAIIKIMSYPNIAYLQYKMKNIRGAQYYTRRTINLIKKRNFNDPMFLFRIIQQEINYSTLYFESQSLEKGINHSLKSILECHSIIDECVREKNFYDNYEDDLLQLYKANINELAIRLYKEIKNNKDELSRSTIVKWKLIERIIKENHE